MIHETCYICGDASRTEMCLNCVSVWISEVGPGVKYAVALWGSQIADLVRVSRWVDGL